MCFVSLIRGMVVVAWLCVVWLWLRNYSVMCGVVMYLSSFMMV